MRPADSDKNCLQVHAPTKQLSVDVSQTLTMLQEPMMNGSCKGEELEMKACCSNMGELTVLLPTEHSGNIYGENSSCRTPSPAKSQVQKTLSGNSRSGGYSSVPTAESADDADVSDNLYQNPSYYHHRNNSTASTELVAMSEDLDTQNAVHYTDVNETKSLPNDQDYNAEDPLLPIPAVSHDGVNTNSIACNAPYYQNVDCRKSNGYTPLHTTV